jgi:hypothetical protein
MPAMLTVGKIYNPPGQHWVGRDLERIFAFLRLKLQELFGAAGCVS